ncbi:putative thiamine transporter SLC35F3, partial [Sinocyclocheilus grahami]|uniref:putative thiamine transporter SLC35F3 n=1 Tax=Sinocyclocheilus grahami TaxID=75366 RepID=UPI0007AC76BD
MTFILFRYKIVAAILAIAGIVMLTYADGFHSHSVIGITLVVASASASALYKVLFKLVLGSAKFGEAALFLTIVGGANFVFMSFVPVILYFTHVEYFTSI